MNTISQKSNVDLCLQEIARAVAEKDLDKKCKHFEIAVQYLNFEINQIKK